MATSRSSHAITFTAHHHPLLPAHRHQEHWESGHKKACHAYVVAAAAQAQQDAAAEKAARAELQRELERLRRSGAIGSNHVGQRLGLL